MATSTFVNAKAITTHQTTKTKTTIPKAEIEAIQSIPPSAVTTPREVRRVLSSPPSSPGGGTSFGGCLHLVLYYNKASTSANEDIHFGSIHAGWVKESLAGALSGQPLLAGRIQRGEAGDGFVVVANDAGVRLVEARIGLALADFLVGCAKTGSSKCEAEAELVFWKDVSEIDPQFSPLFYVQVTNFKCGGYSFGISCSILLADLVLNENFFKRWTEIHNNLLHKNGAIEKPLFYLPNLKKDLNSTIGNIFSTTASKDSGQTVVFNVTSSKQNNDYSSAEISTVMTLCVDEAESKLGNKPATELIFLMFPSEPKNVVNIEKLSRHEVVAKSNVTLANIGPSSWENFGGKELQFLKGNRPVCVSHWIGSVSSEIVMGIPYSYGEQGTRGLRLIVKFPNY